MMTLIIIGGAMILLALLYAFIMMLALTGITLPLQTRDDLPEASPFLSVIVTVRNEEETIKACLETIVTQELAPPHYEIIVSDDFSEDRTSEIVRDCMKRWPRHNWVFVTGEADTAIQPGKKSALARAIKQAKGSLIVTTDADTGRGKYWLSSIIKCYESTTAKMILGPVTFTQERTLLQRLETLEFLGIMGVTAGLANRGMAVMCNGANLVYEKTVFEQTGGFKEHGQFASGDDQFLLGAIKKRYGGDAVHFLLDQDAIVQTKGATNICSFFRQRLRWVSKSRGYSDRFVLFTGAVTYLFQAVLLGGVFLGFLSLDYLFLSIALLLLKLLVDLPIVASMARFFGKRKLLWWYIPAQIFQLIYVTISVPLAFIIPVSWKGRKIQP